MTVAIIAAIAMAVQDVLSTVMVMAEAKNRGWLAGIMDGLCWIVGITTTTISINALNGHSLSTKIAVIALVTLANVFGTKAGQLVGQRYVTDATTLAERVARLEALNPHIHD